jgi:RWP-RK domain
MKTQAHKITKEEIENTMHLPHHEACIVLRVSTAELNKLSRDYGISRFVERVCNFLMN